MTATVIFDCDIATKGDKSHRRRVSLIGGRFMRSEGGLCIEGGLF